MSKECTDFGSPFCGLSNIRQKIEDRQAFVYDNKLHVLGGFSTGLEITDVVRGRRLSEEERLWESVNLGCIACGNDLVVTHEIDGNFVQIDKNY